MEFQQKTKKQQKKKQNHNSRFIISVVFFSFCAIVFHDGNHEIKNKTYNTLKYLPTFTGLLHQKLLHHTAVKVLFALTDFVFL